MTSMAALLTSSGKSVWLRKEYSLKSTFGPYSRSSHGLANTSAQQDSSTKHVQGPRSPENSPLSKASQTSHHSKEHSKEDALVVRTDCAVATADLHTQRTHSICNTSAARDHKVCSSVLITVNSYAADNQSNKTTPGTHFQCQAHDQLDRQKAA